MYACKCMGLHRNLTKGQAHFLNRGSDIKFGKIDRL